MWLCGFYYGACRVESCLALCPRVFFFFFFFFSVLRSPLLGKRELVYVLLVHLFIYFVNVNFCPFSLPLGVRDWLPLVIVAPGNSQIPAVCVCVCVYSGLTSLSTIFQSYHDGVWLRQGAQCSLL